MRARTLATGLCLGLLTGCAAVGPDYAGAPASTAQAVANFPSSGAADQRLGDSKPPASWWRELEDERLDALIDAALAANYDLRIAVANVEAARAALAIQGTRRRPKLDANATVEEARNAAALIQQLEPDTELPTATRGSFSLDLSWEVDLFGRVRRSIEAASADLGSLEAVRNGVITSVLGRVARAYIDLRGAQTRLDVAGRNVEVRRQTLELVMLLNAEGAATELDVARARTQLLTSQAIVPSLQADTTAALNRLAALTARPPGGWSSELSDHAPLPEVPEFVALGTPADLLRRRPDIQAAERALAAASARIGVATADLFPSVSFGARLGVAAQPLSSLDAAGAPFFALGPTVSWNLFDREATYALIRQQDAATAADMARYEAAVTNALEEVDSAVNAWLNERDRRLQLQAARDASHAAWQLAQVRYKEGVEDFLTVLEAQRSLLLVDDQLAQSQIDFAQKLIDIYLALGGGWETTTPIPASK
jgi:outer membrane protein, multidrug efflux system